MKYVVLLTLLALAACGSDKSGSTDKSAAMQDHAGTVDEAAAKASGSMSEEIKGTLEKAEDVEDVLKKAAAEADKAIEEAAGE